MAANKVMDIFADEGFEGGGGYAICEINIETGLNWRRLTSAMTVNINISRRHKRLPNVGC